MELANFIQSNNVGLYAGLLCDAGNILVPVQLFLVSGQSNATATMPACGLTRFLFQISIQLDSMVTNLGKVKTPIEVRALAGSVLTP